MESERRMEGMVMQKRRHWWVYVLIFLVSQLSAVGITYLVTMLGGGSVMDVASTLVMNLVVANVLAILLFLLYRPPSLTWHGTLAGVLGGGWRRSLQTFLLALPVILVVNLLQELFFSDIPDLLDEETLSLILHHPLGLLTVTLIGPLCEELLFRGGVQTALEASRLRRHYGFIIVGAFIFSCVHLNPAQMPAAFVIGIVLGFAYWWTGSLLSSVCIHVFNNSLACLLVYLSPGDESLVQFLGGTQAAVLAIVVCICLFVAVVWRICRD